MRNGSKCLKIARQKLFVITTPSNLRWSDNNLAGRTTIVPKRYFFDFSKLPNLHIISNKTKEYAEQRLLGYSMKQMYEVVADVDKYVEFVPWCKSSKVINRQNDTSAQADLTVGFPPMMEKYRSNLTLRNPELVKSVCSDGRLFKTLITTWEFSPGLPENSNSCTLHFSVSFSLKKIMFCERKSFSLLVLTNLCSSPQPISIISVQQFYCSQVRFEFRSAIYANLSQLVFDEIVRTMVHAFLNRARRLYGPASINDSQMRPKIIKFES